MPHVGTLGPKIFAEAHAKRMRELDGRMQIVYAQGTKYKELSNQIEHEIAWQPRSIRTWFSQN